MRQASPPHRSILLALVLLLAAAVPFATHAERMAPAQLPATLRDWVDWVLFPDRAVRCPFVHDRFDERRCSWPTELELQLGRDGGRFRQRWSAHDTGWANLPGDASHWPQDVRIDERPAVVTTREGRPAVRLTPGQHLISGVFAWPRRPESLPIPRDTALLRLSIDEHTVAEPQLDDAGNLWLRESGARPDAAPSGNRLTLRVFRRVVDEIPLQIVTHLELQVSGAQREEVLSGALPPGFIPLQLDSRLPARLEKDGTLRLQLRPGSWVVELTARYPGPVTQLELASAPPPWPAEEVWSFEAHPELRLVELDGPPAVDPTQTALPESWRDLPAYLMQPGSRLLLHELRRGDPQPAPDALTLQRDLWLDFDGGGYTIRDRIGGTVNRGWRMVMNEPTVLGQALLDGELQLITAGADGRPGIEVRRGQLDLQADSRFQASRSHLPAVGWDQDFQHVEAVLHLPPGWKLFAAGGVDNVPPTWISNWTLLDIFLVLIGALAVRALWNWRIGLLALLTFALIWHEPDAPRAVWLHLLGAIALLRVLPEGVFRRLIAAYRNLAFVALLLFAVPFMIDQLRTGLYPQLGQTSMVSEPMSDVALPAPPPVMQEAMRKGTEAIAGADIVPGQDAARATLGAALGSAAQRPLSARIDDSTVVEHKSLSGLPTFDPDELLQTGPGLPDWQWRDVPLGWNGPVQRGQQISLTLLSPRMNLLLNVLRVLLLAALAVALIGSARLRSGTTNALGNAAAALALACLLPTALLQAPPAYADIPDEKLLEQLHERLLAAPECLPECAQFARLRVELTPSALTLRAELHAAEDTALPLPVNARNWIPAEVSVDGAAATGLLRARDGVLWIHLDAGVHQVLLRGAAPASGTFHLPLPLAPRRIDATLDGWSMEGVADAQPVGAQLQFTRVQSVERDQAAAAPLQAGELPPLLRVERTLSLDLDWHVLTRVSRVSPSGVPVVLRIPLLHGEAVTTDAIRVEDGQALVNLAAGADSVAWQSTLEPAAQIELTAADNTQWFETWRAYASRQWHMESTGIAVVHHRNHAGTWAPEWRPWPGEKVALTLTRPKGIAGPTLTLDAVRLQVVPGRRATDTTATFTLRSSRGGQHTVLLPTGSTLQSVSIDGVLQPIRQEGERVTLPLTPGTRSAELVLRDDAGISTLFRTPAIDTGLASVNTQVNVTPGQDRWILLLGGLPLGPAVLFWGILSAIVLFAFGLGRLRWTPLGTWQWMLLAVGLTQTQVWAALLIVGWLLALGWRGRVAPDHLSQREFNALQLGLFVLTLAAIVLLFAAVKQGLLGYPQMQIAGNGSSVWDLRWYQDRSAATLPRAWVLSVPLWVYRALMLGWALWLAFALLRWLRWGWENVSRGGLWKRS
ncbi:MAG: hypothetical protein H7A12_00480 [Pseudomonadales bacterium]|jgi:hypothetical protein|nr:hypothetical protein [Pseudomonadales bacterium]MCP5319305.1 hypothetical protein [Pseudomonadales bacterium]